MLSIDEVSGRFSTDTDGLSHLFRLRQVSMLLPNRFERPESFVGHGSGSPGSEIDVRRNLLAGGRQEALFGVIHAEEVVDSFLIVVEQLKRNPNPIAFSELSQIGDMALESESGTNPTFRVSLAHAQPGREAIECQVESHGIATGVHVLVVVQPSRLDFHSEDFERIDRISHGV